MHDVSVIVPVYNAESYLNECVKSIVRQDYAGRVELILVDDGSTDSSGDICDSWGKKADNLVVVHKPNGGLVSAWKAGLLRSTADWIVFVDADDWIETSHIRALATEQVACGADIVVARMKQAFSDGTCKRLEWAAETKRYSGKALREELYPIMLNAGKFEVRGVPCSRCSKLIRKSLLLNNLKYSDEAVSFEEDMNIMFPVMLDSECISLIDEENAAYCYRMVGDSMLHGYDTRMMDSVPRVFRALSQACQDKGVEGFDDQVDMELMAASVRLVTNELQNPSGVKTAQDNISAVVERQDLRHSLGTASSSFFPHKYAPIVRMLKKYGWVERNIMTPMLYEMRKWIR